MGSTTACCGIPYQYPVVYHTIHAPVHTTIPTTSIPPYHTTAYSLCVVCCCVCVVCCTIRTYSLLPRPLRTATPAPSIRTSLRCVWVGAVALVHPLCVVGDTIPLCIPCTPGGHTYMHTCRGTHSLLPRVLHTYTLLLPWWVSIPKTLR